MNERQLKERLDWIMEGEMARGVWYAKEMKREIDSFFELHNSMDEIIRKQREEIAELKSALDEVSRGLER